MTSYIISHNDQKIRESYARDFCLDRGVNTLDITEFPFRRSADDGEGVEKEKASIGIADIKGLLAKIHLKPFQSTEKAILIHEADTLTPEAQNALLKVLEEPPNNTLLLLTVASKENLLPTIRSRCTIIAIADAKATLSDDEKKAFADIVVSLPEYTIADALKLAETLAKNKNQALSWLEKCVLVAREQLLLDATNPKRLSVIKALQECYVVLKTTNVNTRLALENLFLSIPQKL